MAARDIDFETYINNGYETLVKQLKIRNGAASVRMRIAGNFDHFCVVEVGSDDELLGHLSGIGKNATFKIFKEKNETFLDISRDTLSASFTHDQSRELIEKAVLKLIKQVESVRKFPLPYKYMKGFYLRSVGKKSVGKKGLKTIDEAVQLKRVDPSFKQTLIRSRITMYKV